MSQADPWSWGADEGSATESDQWSNGWGVGAHQQQQQQQQQPQQQHHQLPPVGQPFWGDSSGGVRGVGPPPKGGGGPPPKGNRQPMYGRPQQRVYPTVPVNNNVANPLRTDVENSEIAPPDAYSNVGGLPLQRPGATASPHQHSRSQPVGPPVNAVPFFNQRPPEPAQEAFSYTQSQESFTYSQSGPETFTSLQSQVNQQQFKQQDQQNFFNQFSDTPNNNNQDFFQHFLTTSEWNGGNKTNEGIGIHPQSNNQFDQAVDNFNKVHDNFSSQHFNHQNIQSHPEIVDKPTVPAQDFFIAPNDQLVPPQNVPSHQDIGSSRNVPRNQEVSMPPLQNYFTLPTNDQEVTVKSVERKHEDSSTENGLVPDRLSYGDNSKVGLEKHNAFVNEPTPDRDYFLSDQSNQRQPPLAGAEESSSSVKNNFSDEQNVKKSPFREVQENRVDAEGLAAPKQEQGPVRHLSVLEGQEHDAPVGISIPSQPRDHQDHEYPNRNLSMIDGHEDVRSGRGIKDDSTPSTSKQTQRREKPQGESSEHIHSKKSVPEAQQNLDPRRSEKRDDRRGEGQERSQSGLPEDEQDWESWDAEESLQNDEYPKREPRRSSPRFPSPGQAPEVGSAFRKYEAASREAEGESSPPPPRGPAAGHSPSPPRRPMLPDNQETLPDISSITLNQSEDLDEVYALDRNEYLETSQLSTQSLPDPRQQRHFASAPRGPRGSGEREIEGEADGGGRVVVGGGRKQPVHSTPVVNASPSTASQLQGPPAGQPGQHSPSGRQDDRADISAIREGGSGDGDDYRPLRSSSSHHHHHRGPLPQQGSRSNRSRHNRHRPPSSHRESSYDEDEEGYSSGGGPRSRRHRPQPSASTSRSMVQSSEYISDEEYEYDSRRSYHRDRRRERDYSPDYARRDPYRSAPRDERRRDRDYYDRRGYSRHDSEDPENFRPSSRGGSDYHVRRHRTPNVDSAAAAWSQYYNQASGFGYEYNQEFYELMRRTNPVLYALWYNDYMSKVGAANDRASVHSGQSGRGLLSTDRVPSTSTPPTRSTDAVHGEESVDTASLIDYTPRLFSSAHIKASHDCMGRVIIVDAHEPIDGQSASVVLGSVEQLYSSCDPAFAQFLECPGPFVPNLTHRSTVLQFLKRQSDQASFSSEKLLYDFVHLTLKSNGTANVSDVAELLMESYNNTLEKRKRGRSGSGASGSTSTGGNLIDDVVPPIQSNCGVDDQTAPLDGFRDLLQQGDKSQALEWAIGRNLWGHALLLSSKMDNRTHQAVTGRFAASLPPSDPLQTLYQLMSGLIPQAASSCGDSKWCDWRPHLAMMLSNSGVELVSGLGGHDQKSPLADLTSRSILVMADTLASRGRFFAAHFCYLVAKVAFSSVEDNDSRLVLLGASPEHLDYRNYRSLMLTMCYEFAIRQADPSFTIKSLPKFKAMAAWKLADAGRSRAALQYCEAIAQDAQLGNCNADAIAWVAQLAEHLEALESHGAQRPEWIINLLALNDSLPQDETILSYPNQTLQSHQPTQHSFRFQPKYVTEEVAEPQHQNDLDNTDGHVQPGPLMMNPAEPLMQPPPLQLGIQQPMMQQSIQQSLMQQNIQQPLMQQSVQQPLMQQGIQQPSIPQSNQQSAVMQSVVQPSTPQHHAAFQPQQNQQLSNGYQEALPVEAESEGFLAAEQEPEVIQPTASKPMNFFHVSEHQLQAEGHPGEVKRPLQPPHQPTSTNAALSQNDKKPSSDPGAGGSGWLGSIMGKFSLRPKNQMILPDDKDPKIVYDPNLKSWVDKDGGGGSAKEMKPPPPLGSGPSSLPSAPVGGPRSLPAAPGGAPPSLPGGQLPSMGMGGGPASLPPSSGANANRYKLQKGKSMKSNYVDVLGGSGAAKPMAQLPQAIFNPGLSQGAPEAETQGGYSEMGNIAMETQQPFMYNPGTFPS